MVAVPAYVCGPCTRMQCGQKSALGLVELELQTSEPPHGCWGPDSGSSARAPGALTADRVSSRHQASLVSPTRENLFTQRPCKYPRNLESLSYCSLPESFISSAVGNHESLWCWTPSTGEGTDAAALEQKSSALMATVCLGTWLRSGDTLFTNSNSLLFLSLCSCFFG